jgi:hypothetical protein
MGKMSKQVKNVLADLVSLVYLYEPMLGYVIQLNCLLAGGPVYPNISLPASFCSHPGQVVKTFLLSLYSPDGLALCLLLHSAKKSMHETRICRKNDSHKGLWPREGESGLSRFLYGLNQSPLRNKVSARVVSGLG